MSHVCSIKTRLYDIEAVKSACTELGLIFKENQSKIRWYGKWLDDYAGEDAAYKLGIDPKQYGTCQHAIEVPGCSYDIGLLEDKKEGGYRLYFDFYGEGKKIQAALGDNGQKLLQYYAAHKVKKEAAKKGYIVTPIKTDNGHIKLQLTNV